MPFAMPRGPSRLRNCPRRTHEAAQTRDDGNAMLARGAGVASGQLVRGDSVANGYGIFEKAISVGDDIARRMTTEPPSRATRVLLHTA